jgi:hypothetical protein
MSIQNPAPSSSSDSESDSDDSVNACELLSCLHGCSFVGSLLKWHIAAMQVVGADWVAHEDEDDADDDHRFALSSWLDDDPQSGALGECTAC